MKPDSVGNIVAQVLEEIKKKKGKEVNIVDAWKEVAGRKTLRHTRPATFKAGVLVVDVESASWLYELNISKPHLLRKMKKKFSDGSLRELRFRLGAI